jgi:hypothetical protein
MDKLLEEIRKIEFEQIDYQKEDHEYFGVIKGNIPILISAPHGSKHMRNGLWKEEDEYTSSIAIKLGQMTGAHVIYVKNRTTEDSNFDESAKYKDAAKRLIKEERIKFLADIHGAKPSRNFKIDVGVINEKDMDKCSCRELMPVIAKALKDFQTPLFNQNFSANHPGTMTFFARNKCGIEAAQFEINARYRIIERKPDSSKAVKGEDPDYKAKEEDVLELFNRMMDMILKIERKIRELEGVWGSYGNIP